MPNLAERWRCWTMVTGLRVQTPHDSLQLDPCFRRSQLSHAHVFLTQWHSVHIKERHSPRHSQVIQKRAGDHPGHQSESTHLIRTLGSSRILDVIQLLVVQIWRILTWATSVFLAFYWRFYFHWHTCRPVGSGAAWRRSPHQKSAGRKRERERKEEKWGKKLKAKRGERKERGEKLKKGIEEQKMY